MDINSLVDSGLSFFQDHTLWAVLAVVVIGAVIFWKPKATLTLGLIGFVVAAFIYVFAFIFDLASTGIEETEKFTTTPEIKVD